MYIPAPFAETDLGTLQAFMEAHPLGALVSATAGAGLYATHLPLLLDRSRGPYGVLQGHIARANPHASLAQSGDAALVIFSGPDAYISPAHYPSKQAHGKVVPTWNYSAVHATGTLTLFEDTPFLEAHLAHLTTHHEASQAHPWAMHDAPADFLAQQMRAIVGVEFTITRLEGKYKMSQNRAHADIDGVIAGLGASPDARVRDVAAQVAARKPQR
jgi:transcriptional regulator